MRRCNVINQHFTAKKHHFSEKNPVKLNKNYFFFLYIDILTNLLSYHNYEMYKVDWNLVHVINKLKFNCLLQLIGEFSGQINAVNLAITSFQNIQNRICLSSGKLYVQ